MRISDWSSDVCSSDLPLRLRHREAVRLLVAGIVADGVRPDDIAGIRQRVSALVAPDDTEDVVAPVVNELHQLHEGNIARYRLRLSPFRQLTTTPPHARVMQEHVEPAPTAGVLPPYSAAATPGAKRPLPVFAPAQYRPPR